MEPEVVKKSIAIINDDVNQLRLLEKILSTQPYHISAFTGAEEALKRIDPACLPDLIITDLFMPGIDGWRFCRLLRSPEYKAFNPIPILVVSATFSGDDADSITADTGANAFLPMPVDKKTLITTVEAMLGEDCYVRKSRVLIVDDTRSITAILKDAFESNGYDVHVAHDGREARQAFDTGAFDVIVLDYHLPDTTGEALLSEFHVKQPDAVIMMITVDPDPELALRWLKKGASAYIRKPFATEYLMALCAKARREKSLFRVERLLEERTTLLRENEHRLNSLLNNLTDAVWSVSLPDLKTLYISPSVEKLYGRSAQEFIENPSLWQEVTHPDDRHLNEEAFAQVLQNGEAVRECRIIRSDGSIAWIWDKSKLVFDSNHQPVRIEGVVSDITIRKQAEEKLQKSEARYLSIIEDQTDLICRYRPDGRLSFVNGAYARYYGKSRSELIDRSFIPQIPEPDQRMINGQLARITRENPSIDFEHRIITPSGEVRWQRWTHRGIYDPDGRLLEYQAVGSDITDQKKAEDELKQIEWMLSRKSTPDTVCQTENHDQGYGDLTELNCDGIILKSIGPELLKSFASDYMELLGTSSAIYEVNGDYAFGIFSSGWCRMMDAASRKRCNTADNVEALNSGQWLCHESCWTDCAKVAIARGMQVDIECNGGIRLCAVPIFANGTVVGAINFGYGDPPKDEETLRKLADTYYIHYDDLVREAFAYESRPPYIIEMAKNRLHTTARLIGSMIETRQTEEALLESQSALTKSQEIAHVGTWILDLPENRLTWSDEVYRILGFDPGEIEPTYDNFLQLVHPDDRAMVDQTYTTSLKQENGGYEIQHRIVRHRTGEVCYVHEKGLHERNAEGAVVRSTGIIQDITDRKKTEEELVHQFEFQRLIAEISSRFVKFGSDLLDDNINMALRRIGEFFDVDRSYVVIFSEDHRTMDNTHEWCAQGVAPRIDRSQNYPVNRFAWMYEQMKKMRPAQVTDMEDLPEEASDEKALFCAHNIKSLICFPMVVQDTLIGFMGLHSIRAQKFWGEGQRALLWVVAEIISGAMLRKQAEEAILQAKKEADEANRAKSRFLSNMSHEIRTPMAGIMGMLDVLGKTEENPEQLRMIGMIQTSARSLLTIINDILDLSKIEANRLALSNENFRLDRVLEKTVSLFSPVAAEKKLKLLVEKGDDVPNLLYGDPHRLEQILKNLVSNAIKFTHKGHVLIKVSRDVLSESSFSLLFEVRDTGIGIPEDVMPNLFESFTQADSSHSKNYGGTGLGLAISRNLAELMGGRMWAESQAGVGSAFFFTIPFQAGTEEVAEQGDPVASAETGLSEPVSLNILAAEDVDINQEYLSFLLNEAGHRFVMVSNGKEALLAYREQPFDLILMDIQMPEMGGIEATRQIRFIERKENRAAIPIIALTAYAIKEEQDKIMEAGMDGYVTKPIDPEKLFSEIRRVTAGIPVAEKDAVPEGGLPENKTEHPVSPLNRALAENRYGGRVELWERMVHKFIEAGAGHGYIADLMHVIEEGDFEKIYSVAHTAKGTFGVICAERAMETAAGIESAAKSGDLAGCRMKVKELEEELERIKTANKGRVG